MKIITRDKAHKILNDLIVQIAIDGEPVRLTGRHANVVLVAEEEWLAMQESLYLL